MLIMKGKKMGPICPAESERRMAISLRIGPHIAGSRELGQKCWFIFRRRCFKIIILGALKDCISTVDQRKIGFVL